MLLREQIIEGVVPAQTVTVDLFADHDDKFEAGMAELGELRGMTLPWALRVTGNVSPSSTTVRNPLQPDQTVSVPASITGLFSDGLGGDELDPTVDLRFKLLYVDFEPATGEWTRPGKTYRRDGIVARWEIE